MMPIRLASSITLLFGLVLVASPARADDDPPNVCIELHCYCDGPDEPDTVGPCETTCEDLCAGRSSGGGHAWATQRVSFGAFLGGGSRVADAGGTSAGKVTSGADLRLIMGSKPLLGIELTSGVMITSAGTPGGADQTVAYVPLLVGLSSTPKLHRGKRSEFRLDLGADVGFLFGVRCEGCKVNAFSSQLRAGIDTYLGRDRTGGIALNVVYIPGHIATFDAGSQELRPPTVLFHLAFIWRKSALLW